MWVCGWWKKSRLICYVSRLGRRKISEPATARHVCFIAVTEEVVRGRGWQNVLIQTQEWEMTEKLDGQEERVRQMHMATVEMRLKV